MCSNKRFGTWCEVCTVCSVREKSWMNEGAFKKVLNLRHGIITSQCDTRLNILVCEISRFLSVCLVSLIWRQIWDLWQDWWHLTEYIIPWGFVTGVASYRQHHIALQNTSYVEMCDRTGILQNTSYIEICDRTGILKNSSYVGDLWQDWHLTSYIIHWNLLQDWHLT